MKNKAVGRSVAMETDKKDRATLEIGQAFPMNEPHAIEVDPPNEPVKGTMPESCERGHRGVIERSLPQKAPFSKLMFLLVASIESILPPERTILPGRVPMGGSFPYRGSLS